MPMLEVACHRATLATGGQDEKKIRKSEGVWWEEKGGRKQWTIVSPLPPPHPRGKTVIGCRSARNTGSMTKY